MSRKKLKRFAEVASHPYVFEFSSDTYKEDIADFVSGDEEVVLELGCGSGQYTVGLAELFPEKKFMGMDVQGERLWYGMHEVDEKKIKNVRFLRDQIQIIDQVIPPHSIDEVWITFPDPHPRKGGARKRLTSGRFLELYKKILKPGGLLHLKTDNTPLFEFSVETVKDFGCNVEKIIDKVPENTEDPVLRIQTYFEQKHRALGDSIHYMRFSFSEGIDTIPEL